MVEIEYPGRLEVADITAHTIEEARKLFSIPRKTTAYLNGRMLEPEQEPDTILNDEDRLEFKYRSRKNVIYLCTGLLITLVITGGFFADGFINATATLDVTNRNENFADVSASATCVPLAVVRGLEKGRTGSGNIFIINTFASGYTGDLCAVVTIANASDLIGIYRNLVLTLEVRDSAGALVDINTDGVNCCNDMVLLTLENPGTAIYITQAAVGVYTIKLKCGYFICNPAGPAWTSCNASPVLYCEVSQK